MKKLSNKELYYKIGKENIWENGNMTCKIAKKEDLSNCAKKNCESCRHYISKSDLIDWVASDYDY